VVIVGVCVGVRVEGEEESPIEERTDGKFLADLVREVYYDDVVTRLGLPPGTADVLKRLPEEDEEQWQDPTILKRALEDLRRSVPTIGRDPRLQQGFAISKRDLDDRLKDYDTAVEDAIRICEWAVVRGKQVALTMW